MAAGAGALSAGSGVTTRILSERGGPHDGLAPPAMLLSSRLRWLKVFAALLEDSAPLSPPGGLQGLARSFPRRSAS